MPGNTGADSERSTIVVANALAAQQWEMHLSAAQIAGRATAWATPPLATYATWLDGLWAEHGGDRGEPLTAGQSAALWRRVLAESSESAELIGQAGAAEWAANAWQLLHRWRLDPAAQRAYPDQLDYRAFLSWCRSYRERLDAHGWIDRAELEGPLATRALRGKGRLVAADLIEAYPARAALFAQLDTRGCTVTATTAPVVAGTRRAARLADSTDELRAALAWAARRLAEQPGARVAIVVADNARRHGEIERLVATALGDPPRPVGSSEGRTLGAEPAVGAAFDALTLLAPRTPYAAFGRWLRSPFFAAALPEQFARAKLDRQLRTELVSQLPFATAYRCGLKERLETQTPQSAAALAGALTTLGGTHRAVLSRWAYVFTRILTVLGWQPPTARTALLGWHGSLDELARLTPILGEVTLDTALAELERILGRPGPAVLPVSGVHVLSHIGDVGPGYAGVWVTGLTDAAWPEPPHGNPLVPLAVQREHTMPYCSPRDAEERSAHAFERLVQRAPELVVSWPARVYDYETEPSPAIRDWPLLTAADLDERVATRPPGGTVARETVGDPGPPLAATHLPGGTGALGRQARCPLRAFCEYRLGARELEPLRFGLSPRLRGIATHRAAELLLRDLPTQSELAGRAGAVAASAEQALGRLFGRARAPLAELFALEVEQLERVLVALLRAEAARAPFRIVAIEQRSDGVLGGWTLRARVDRIDELADGSIAIVDYKTSERTSADWFSPRLRDAQVPLYASHAVGRVGAAVVARLTPLATTYSGLWSSDAFPGRPSKFARAQPEEQITVWRAQLLELATELASGDTRIFQATYDDAAKAYAPLTRVFEQLALARGAAARW